MAAYKVENAWYLSANHLTANRAVADHTTPLEDKSLDRNGQPEVAFNPVERGTIVYSVVASYDALSEGQKQRARYMPDETASRAEQAKR